jgi:ABC-type glycerol-3-phosphate transport system substrate-binding protein
MLGYGGTYEWYPWLWEAGGQLLTADGTKVAFNSPEGLQATKAFLGLYTTQKVIPEAAKTWQSWDELEAAFASGLIAMYEAGDWVLAPTDAKKPAFEWGVAPLPMEKTTSSEVGGANWMINKNTKNPDAAYKWVEFITGPDVFGLMDSYKRQAARKGGTQQIDTADPRMQVFLGILDYAQALPSQPNWTNVDYNCLEPDFQKVLLQGASVESVMADAETCGNNALAGK